MLKGMICLFFGLIAAIPDGWLLCDGTNSTPDLRNRFVVGAGDTYAVGDSNGSINHNHDFTSNTHGHGIQIGTAISFVANFNTFTNVVAVTGTTDSENGLPPYKSLSYIMKEG